jgi:hypothetical protein
MTVNYDDLAQQICHSPTLTKVVKIANVDVRGTFDPITKMLVWQADYAIRDEAYVKSLIERERMGLV